MNKQTFRKQIMPVLVSAITIYLVIMFIMALMQRRFIYFPSALDSRYEYPQVHPDQEEVNITAEDGIVINGIFIPPPRPEADCIIIFHGNAGNIVHREYLLHGLQAIDAGVLLFDYHGYGKSGGRPSEKNLYKDGEAVITWLGEEKKISTEQMILFGKSLGSGVATEMAVRYPVKGLLLDSAFASMGSTAGRHYPFLPVNLLLIDKYDNVAKIARINCPLQLIHGTADRVISPKESEILYEAAQEPKAILRMADAGHNDYPGPEYWQTISKWIGDLK